MLARFASLVLGDSWRTSLAALAAAVAYASQAVPAIAQGTATAADYRHAAVAGLVYLMGRFAQDGRKP
jgi:hypothetical protein